MKLDDRHQMVAIYIQAEEAEKINLAKLIEKRAYETAISRHQYFRLIIKSIRIKLRKQRFYANHSLPHQRYLGHPNENVLTEQDEGQKISKTFFLGFNSSKGPVSKMGQIKSIYILYIHTYIIINKTC